MKRSLLIALCCLLGTTACGVQHIKTFKPRERNYKPGRYETAPKSVSEGSLWQEGSRSLVADFRASRVGDLVTVRIDESPEAAGDAATNMDRDADWQIGAPKILGFAQAIKADHPDLDMGKLFQLMSSSNFKGNGETTRGSKVEASMAVRVRRQLPNGDLFLEGTKVLMINDEELHIYVSGVVRPEDIAQDNSVSSAVIADAEIEFTGRGVLTDNQRQGWLSRFLSSINPF
ncbi:MAG TPA: flagellar basal body L-ring protein FlgH [Polyangiales bacterium]|nr:flagellar basal body L-ring protein FlgH [Polyangiales bacterium]